MKKISQYIIFSLFLFISYIPLSHADFIYKEWDSDVELTDFGRKVDLTIKAEVELPKNYYHNSWSYIFDKKSNVSIQSVRVNNRSVKHDFKNNELQISLPKTQDGSRLKFDIKYIINSDFHPFIRREFVSIPKWANGAKGSLSVRYPYNMTVYSSHPSFKHEEYRKQFKWNGIVPPTGLSEMIRMTLDSGRWKVENKTIVKGTKKFRYIELKAPISFRGGNYIVEKLEADIYPRHVDKIDKGSKFYTLQYRNAKSNEVYFMSKATLRNGVNFSKNMSIPANDYLKVTDDEIFLKGVMDEIYKSEFYNKNEPLYKVISKWVNNHIQYDISQFGRQLSVKDIYKYRRGVCEHYSKIYIALCRYNNIPAVEAGGVAYDLDTEEFIRHSWAFVKQNGKWIPIDPTWDITSGILPVSHIFFNFGDCNQASYTAKNVDMDTNDIKIEWDFDVEWRGGSLK